MEGLEKELQELETSLAAAKDDLAEAAMNLRAMIRAFKESRLLPRPGQFSGESPSCAVYCQIYVQCYIQCNMSFVCFLPCKYTCTCMCVVHTCT